MVVKLGRNDLCPCQSGKKYKKCCDKTAVLVDVNIEKELLAVQMDFVHWATRTYKVEIHEFMDAYMKKLELTDEAAQTFNFFSHLWYFASVKHNGQSILDIYIATKPKLLENERLLNIVKEWTETPPSPFIVKNWAPNQYVVVENIFTNETQWVKSLQDHHSNRESGIGIGVGTVLPVEESHVFLMTFFYVPEELETIRGVMNEVKAASQNSGLNTNEFLAQSFMGILEFLMLGTPLDQTIGRQLLNRDLAEIETEKPVAEEQVEAKQQLDEAKTESAAAKDFDNQTGDNPLESEVLEAFIAYARGRQRNDQFLNTGLDLWTTYCLKENPTLRKPQVAAAALFYLVDGLLNEKGITQSQLAKDFFISSTSISSRYKILQTALEDEITEIVEKKVATV